MKILRTISIVLLSILLLFLFFTNDFGVLDIRETSVVVAVGVDAQGGEITITAQVAIPQPSETGNNTKSVQVSGSGKTVGEALSDINAKTGFYPKLIFCKLIILGEGTNGIPIFEFLDYFYRSDFVSRTANIAVCKGKASELLNKKTPTDEISSEVIGRALSQELKRAGKVSIVNLKEIATAYYSKSRACYMPYVNFVEAESGGSVDGSQPEQGGGQDKKYEFTCTQTALYPNGVFAGVLSEEQSFALNLLVNDLRTAVLPFESGGVPYAVGLKKNKGGVSIKMENGLPVIYVKYAAYGEVLSKAKPNTAKDIAANAVMAKQVLKDANLEVVNRINSLFTACASYGCDVLALRQMLWERYSKEYETFAQNILSAQLIVDSNIQSNH